MQEIWGSGSESQVFAVGSTCPVDVNLRIKYKIALSL